MLVALTEDRRLHFPPVDSSGILFGSLRQLPSLHTLVVSSTPSTGVDWNDLAAMPALTSLTLLIISASTMPQPSSPMLNLRTLTMQNERLDRVMGVLATLQAPCLERVQMKNVQMRDPPSDMKGTLLRFPLLHTLRFEGATDLDKLLHVLAGALPPHVRRLELRLQPRSLHFKDTTPASRDLTSRAALEHLLSAVPTLSVVLEMSASIDMWVAEAAMASADTDYEWETIGEPAVRLQWQLLQEAIYEHPRLLVQSGCERLYCGPTDLFD